MHLPPFCVLPNIPGYAQNNHDNYLENKYCSSQFVNHGVYGCKLWFSYTPTHAQLGFIACN